MAIKEWFDKDKYFEFANDYLLKHKKSPNAVIMRDFCEGNGSLSTHQKLIEQWKQTQHVDLIELPEKAETLIVNKARELFAEGWKALEEASREKTLQIHEEANEAIQLANDAMSRITNEKNEVQNELNRISEELKDTTFTTLYFQSRLNEAEKLCFAAEEAKKELVNRFAELQERTQREKSELQTQYESREKELKNQLASNELGYQKEIDRRDEEKEAYKKEHECRISAIEIVRDELYQKLNQASADIKFYETKYQQALKDLEEKTGEIIHLKTQSQNYRSDAQNQKLQIERQVGKLDQLEKQLHEYRENNLQLEEIVRSKSLRVGELEEKLNNILANNCSAEVDRFTTEVA